MAKSRVARLRLDRNGPNCGKCGKCQNRLCCCNFLNEYCAVATCTVYTLLSTNASKTTWLSVVCRTWPLIPCLMMIVVDKRATTCKQHQMCKWFGTTVSTRLGVDGHGGRKGSNSLFDSGPTSDQEGIVRAQMTEKGREFGLGITC